jgi:hypothetical protein
MKTPQLVSEIVKINSTSTTNEFLALGWELIDTHKRLHKNDDGEPIPGNEYICFILGWPRSAGVVKKPSDADLTGIDVDV